jgi:hypothetical protein
VTQPGRKNVDDALTVALASGASAAAAADAAGVSERTVRRRQGDYFFMKGVKEARAQMVSQAVSTLASAGGLAAETLQGLLAEGNPPAVRLAAAKAVLEFLLRPGPTP